MTADDQTTSAARLGSLLSVRRRAGAIARRAFFRMGGPLARRHVREVQTLAAVRRLEADLKQVRERHTEQIERLEDLVRELILSLEALRSASSASRSPSARTLSEDSG
jgi:hypothetical protein